MYKRILLKLSGEQLQGQYDSGFDRERAHWIAEQIKPVIAASTQVVIMVVAATTFVVAKSLVVASKKSTLTTSACSQH